MNNNVELSFLLDFITFKQIFVWLQNYKKKWQFFYKNYDFSLEKVHFFNNYIHLFFDIDQSNKKSDINLINLSKAFN